MAANRDKADKQTTVDKVREPSVEYVRNKELPSR